LHDNGTAYRQIKRESLLFFTCPIKAADKKRNRTIEHRDVQAKKSRMFSFSQLNSHKEMEKSLLQPQFFAKKVREGNKTPTQFLPALSNIVSLRNSRNMTEMRTLD
jgi:hypothetical protein